MTPPFPFTLSFVSSGVEEDALESVGDEGELGAGEEAGGEWAASFVSAWSDSESSLSFSLLSFCPVTDLFPFPLPPPTADDETCLLPFPCPLP